MTEQQGNMWVRILSSGSTWTAWNIYAKVSDMPTKLSQLQNDIGADGGVKITISATEPTTPSPGDFWYKQL